MGRQSGDESPGACEDEYVEVIPQETGPLEYVMTIQTQLDFILKVLGTKTVKMSLDARQMRRRRMNASAGPCRSPWTAPDTKPESGHLSSLES